MRKPEVMSLTPSLQCATLVRQPSDSWIIVSWSVKTVPFKVSQTCWQETFPWRFLFGFKFSSIWAGLWTSARAFLWHLTEENTPVIMSCYSWPWSRECLSSPLKFGALKLEENKLGESCKGRTKGGELRHMWPGARVGAGQWRLFEQAGGSSCNSEASGLLVVGSVSVAKKERMELQSSWLRASRSLADPGRCGPTDQKASHFKELGGWNQCS